MTTSGEQGQRPLTRRELRERRERAAQVQAGSDAGAAAEAVAPPTHTAPPAPEPDPVPEQTKARAHDPIEPVDPPTVPHVVASTAAGSDGQRPLTRREIRRLRTNEIAVVQGADAAPSAPDQNAADSRRDPAPAGREEPITVALPFSGPGSAERESLGQTTPTVFRAPEVTRPGSPQLNPNFGSGLTTGSAQPQARSFDELMNNYAPTSPSSIIMTSSHRLADGIGSTGAARGTTDGRDVDAVLIDGELPAASSPTPIAASAAISTQKKASEVIRPPEPEKGRNAVVALGITAGVLGIVVVGAIVGAFFLGVFD